MTTDAEILNAKIASHFYLFWNLALNSDYYAKV